MDRVEIDRIIGGVTLAFFSIPMFLASTGLYVAHTPPAEMLLFLLAYHIVARICMVVQFGFSITGPDWLPSGKKFFSACVILGFFDVAAVVIAALRALSVGMSHSIAGLYVAEVCISVGYTVTMGHLATHSPDGPDGHHD